MLFKRTQTFCRDENLRRCDTARRFGSADRITPRVY
jgi:hypothetical protein